jgi:ABC-type multidrug transport system fused ATPase/permease subunit
MANGDDKKRKVDWPSAWQESKRLIWARRHRLALGLVLLVISRLSGLVLPATTKVLIDEVIGNRRADLLLWIALAAGGATLIQAMTSFALSIILGVAAQRSINDLRLRVQRHIARLPVRFFEDHKSGELISRIMNDAEGVRNLVGSGFVQLVGGVLTASLSLAVLLWLNWRLTLLTLVLLAVFAAIMVVGFSRLRPIFRERGRITAEVTGRLAESLGGARIIKAYTAEKREERIFAHVAHRLLRNIVRSMVGVSSITSLSSLLFGLVGITMGIMGAREVLAGRMTVGDIFMFVVFTGMMVAPLVQMSAIGTQVTEALAGLDRIREVLSEPTEDVADSERRRLERVDGEVAFEDVSFEYRPGSPVLEEISFHAPAGTTTALVGPSGAGKTTIINLVMAFHRPKSGRITIDGHDLTQVRLRDYRSQLAVVLQDDFLFDGTVAENIAYSRPRANREEVAAAGRVARCDEFVGRFEDGYDTVIGERGVKLSGGQRQRVAIARAVLADPRILILDEATSNLDSESEEWIQQGLAALKKGRTSLVIAHRLSTIRNADQILVLEEGAIVERGNHDQLLAAGGRYKTLYDKQYRLTSDRFINPGEDFTPEPTGPDLQGVRPPGGDLLPLAGRRVLGSETDRSSEE